MTRHDATTDTRQRICRKQRALTIVELLAVMIVLALAASIGARGMMSSHTAATFQEAIALLRSLDRQARIEARTGGPCKLFTVDEDNALMVLDAATREVLCQAVLPRGVRLSIHARDDRSTIHFDRSGQTSDYALEIRTAEQWQQWRVCGLTGLVVDMEEGP